MGWRLRVRERRAGDNQGVSTFEYGFPGSKFGKISLRVAFFMSGKRSRTFRAPFGLSDSRKSLLRAPAATSGHMPAKCRSPVGVCRGRARTNRLSVATPEGERRT